MVNSVRSLETKMPARQHFSRIDTFELKTRIERKVGRPKAEEYFDLLKRFLSLKISKSDFDKLCIDKIGRENVRLHNHLIRSIISNAFLSKTPPSKDHKIEGSLTVRVENGYQRSGIQSLCQDIPQSPRKGRTPNIRDRKFRDRPSPLGPHGKNHSFACEDSIPKIQEQQSATELLSLGSRPPGSVEDGEEVDQAAESPSIYSRSPVRAPLGIPMNTKGTRKVLCSGSATTCFTETCQNSGELPDTSSLRKSLEQKLETEGINISVDCANLLNNCLDVYLKRLIKPCLDLAGSRSVHKHIDQRHDCDITGVRRTMPMRYVQNQSRPFLASMSDFCVAMELNPRILGADWTTELEKVCLRASED
ncbi:uncharacterized protein LOC122304617 isoform X1 [Carya illinoinensis]|uniref:uncharacterized protein LOC122304617 isoform X1 n=2 Tax=Carya illinoinensis TaxID=32201 RepID=UPI001C7299A9|nr:uncharacterized protein LOC122304617 isoform X1 [Carya illinoinensis]